MAENRIRDKLIDLERYHAFIRTLIENALRAEGRANDVPIDKLQKIYDVLTGQNPCPSLEFLIRAERTLNFLKRRRKEPMREPMREPSPDLVKKLENIEKEFKSIKASLNRVAIASTSRGFGNNTNNNIIDTINLTSSDEDDDDDVQFVSATVAPSSSAGSNTAEKSCDKPKTTTTNNNTLLSVVRRRIVEEEMEEGEIPRTPETPDLIVIEVLEENSDVETNDEGFCETKATTSDIIDESVNKTNLEKENLKSKSNTDNNNIDIAEQSSIRSEPVSTSVAAISDTEIIVCSNNVENNSTAIQDENLTSQPVIDDEISVSKVNETVQVHVDKSNESNSLNLVLSPKKINTAESDSEIINAVTTDNVPVESTVTVKVEENTSTAVKSELSIKEEIKIEVEEEEEDNLPKENFTTEHSITTNTINSNENLSSTQNKLEIPAEVSAAGHIAQEHSVAVQPASSSTNIEDKKNFNEEENYTQAKSDTRHTVDEKENKFLDADSLDTNKDQKSAGEVSGSNSISIDRQDSETQTRDAEENQTSVAVVIEETSTSSTNIASTENSNENKFSTTEVPRVANNILIDHEDNKVQTGKMLETNKNQTSTAVVVEETCTSSPIAENAENSKVDKYCKIGEPLGVNSILTDHEDNEVQTEETIETNKNQISIALVEETSSTNVANAQNFNEDEHCTTKVQLDTRIEDTRVDHQNNEVQTGNNQNNEAQTGDTERPTENQTSLTPAENSFEGKHIETKDHEVPNNNKNLIEEEGSELQDCKALDTNKDHITLIVPGIDQSSIDSNSLQNTPPDDEVNSTLQSDKFIEEIISSTDTAVLLLNTEDSKESIATSFVENSEICSDKEINEIQKEIKSNKIEEKDDNSIPALQQGTNQSTSIEELITETQMNTVNDIENNSILNANLINVMESSEEEKDSSHDNSIPALQQGTNQSTSIEELITETQMNTVNDIENNSILSANLTNVMESSEEEKDSSHDNSIPALQQGTNQSTSIEELITETQINTVNDIENNSILNANLTNVMESSEETVQIDGPAEMECASELNWDFSASSDIVKKVEGDISGDALIEKTIDEFNNNNSENTSSPTVHFKKNVSTVSEEHDVIAHIADANQISDMLQRKNKSSSEDKTPTEDFSKVLEVNQMSTAATKEADPENTIVNRGNGDECDENILAPKTCYTTDQDMAKKANISNTGNSELTEKIDEIISIRKEDGAKSELQKPAVTNPLVLEKKSSEIKLSIIDTSTQNKKKETVEPLEVLMPKYVCKTDKILSSESLSEISEDENLPLSHEDKYLALIDSIDRNLSDVSDSGDVYSENEESILYNCAVSKKSLQKAAATTSMAPSSSGDVIPCGKINKTREQEKNKGNDVRLSKGSAGEGLLETISCSTHLQSNDVARAGTPLLDEPSEIYCNKMDTKASSREGTPLMDEKRQIKKDTKLPANDNVLIIQNPVREQVSYESLGHDGILALHDSDTEEFIKKLNIAISGTESISSRSVSPLSITDKSEEVGNYCNDDNSKKKKRKKHKRRQRHRSRQRHQEMSPSRQLEILKEKLSNEVKNYTSSLHSLLSKESSVSPKHQNSKVRSDSCSRKSKEEESDTSQIKSSVNVVNRIKSLCQRVRNRSSSSNAGDLNRRSRSPPQSLRKRSKSPRRSSRDRSPDIRRRRSRSPTPRRHRSRSHTPRRHRSRSLTPRRHRSRSHTPRRHKSRSPTSRRHRSRSLSPRGRRSHSPISRTRRSQSPTLRRYIKDKSLSPDRHKKHHLKTTHKNRHRSKSISPSRSRSRRSGNKSINRGCSKEDNSRSPLYQHRSKENSRESTTNSSDDDSTSNESIRKLVELVAQKSKAYAASIAIDPPLAATASPLAGTASPLAATASLLAATESLLAATESPLAATELPLPATESPLAATASPLAATASLSTDIELPVSEIELPVSDIELPVSDIELPVSEIELHESEIELPESEIKLPLAANESPLTAVKPSPLKIIEPFIIVIDDDDDEEENTEQENKAAIIEAKNIDEEKVERKRTESQHEIKNSPSKEDLMLARVSEESLDSENGIIYEKTEVIGTRRPKPTNVDIKIDLELYSMKEELFESSVKKDAVNIIENLKSEVKAHTENVPNKAKVEAIGSDKNEHSENVSDEELKTVEEHNAFDELTKSLNTSNEEEKVDLSELQRIRMKLQCFNSESSSPVIIANSSSVSDSPKKSDKMDEWADKNLGELQQIRLKLENDLGVTLEDLKEYFENPIQEPTIEIAEEEEEADSFPQEENYYNDISNIPAIQNFISMFQMNNPPQPVPPPNIQDSGPIDCDMNLFIPSAPRASYDLPQRLGLPQGINPNDPRFKNRLRLLYNRTTDSRLEASLAPREPQVPRPNEFPGLNTASIQADIRTACLQEIGTMSSPMGSNIIHQNHHPPPRSTIQNRPQVRTYGEYRRLKQQAIEANAARRRAAVEAANKALESEIAKPRDPGSGHNVHNSAGESVIDKMYRTKQYEVDVRTQSGFRIPKKKEEEKLDPLKDVETILNAIDRDEKQDSKKKKQRKARKLSTSSGGKEKVKGKTVSSDDDNVSEKTLKKRKVRRISSSSSEGENVTGMPQSFSRASIERSEKSTTDNAASNATKKSSASISKRRQSLSSRTSVGGKKDDRPDNDEKKIKSKQASASVSKRSRSLSRASKERASSSDDDVYKMKQINSLAEQFVESAVPKKPQGNSSRAVKEYPSDNDDKKIKLKQSSASVSRRSRSLSRAKERALSSDDDVYKMKEINVLAETALPKKLQPSSSHVVEDNDAFEVHDDHSSNGSNAPVTLSKTPEKKELSKESDQNEILSLMNESQEESLKKIKEVIGAILITKGQSQYECALNLLRPFVSEDKFKEIKNVFSGDSQQAIPSTSIQIEKVESIAKTNRKPSPIKDAETKSLQNASRNSTAGSRELNSLHRGNQDVFRGVLTLNERRLCSIESEERTCQQIGKRKIVRSPSLDGSGDESISSQKRYKSIAEELQKPYHGDEDADTDDYQEHLKTKTAEKSKQKKKKKQNVPTELPLLKVRLKKLKPTKGIVNTSKKAEDVALLKPMKIIPFADEESKTRGRGRGRPKVKKVEIKNINPEHNIRSKIYTKQCVLCSEKALNIVDHYVSAHPDREVFTSRMHSSDMDYLSKNPVIATRVPGTKKKFSATCVLCDKEIRSKFINFHDHYSSHTGEYAYECSNCDVRTYDKQAILEHCKNDCHETNSKYEINYSYQKTLTKIKAYVCTKCNYIQIHQPNVIKHLKSEHGLCAPQESDTLELILAEKIDSDEVLSDIRIANEPVSNKQDDGEILFVINTDKAREYASHLTYTNECDSNISRTDTAESGCSTSENIADRSIAVKTELNSFEDLERILTEVEGNKNKTSLEVTEKFAKDNQIMTMIHVPATSLNEEIDASFDILKDGETITDLKVDVSGIIQSNLETLQQSNLEPNITEQKPDIQTLTEIASNTENEKEMITEEAVTSELKPTKEELELIFGELENMDFSFLNEAAEETENPEQNTEVIDLPANNDKVTPGQQHTEVEGEAETEAEANSNIIDVPCDQPIHNTTLPDVSENKQKQSESNNDELKDPVKSSDSSLLPQIKSSKKDENEDVIWIDDDDDNGDDGDDCQKDRAKIPAARSDNTAELQKLIMKAITDGEDDIVEESAENCEDNITVIDVIEEDENDDEDADDDSFPRLEIDLSGDLQQESQLEPTDRDCGTTDDPTISRIVNVGYQKIAENQYRYYCLIEGCSFLSSSDPEELKLHVKSMHRKQWSGRCNICRQRVTDGMKLEISQEVEHLLHVHIKQHELNQSPAKRMRTDNESNNRSSTEIAENTKLDPVICILKPWVRKTISLKSKPFCHKMNEELSLYCLYKCLGNNCSFSTSSKSGMSFHLHHHETRHIELQANRSWLECSYCEHVADSCENILNHVYQVHRTSKFQCSKCFYRSSTAYNILVHQNMFHRFENDNFILTCYGKLKSTANEMPEICEKRAANVKPLVCEVCKTATFYVIDYLQKHMETMHKRKSDLIDVGLYACIFCSFETNDLLTIREHMANCHPNELLYVCGRLVNKESAMQTSSADITTINSTSLVHIGGKVDKSAFKQCPIPEAQLHKTEVSFGGRICLIQSNIVDLTDSEEPVSASSSRRSSGTEVAQKYDMKIMNFDELERILQPTESSKTEVKKLQSDQKENLYKKLQELVNIATNSNNQTVYACCIVSCTEGFSNFIKWKNHLRLKHPDSSYKIKYKCPHCPEEFLLSDFDTHFEQHKIHRYFCYFCGKTFSQASIAEEHLINTHFYAKAGIFQILPKFSENEDPNKTSRYLAVAAPTVRRDSTIFLRHMIEVLKKKYSSTSSMSDQSLSDSNKKAIDDITIDLNSNLFDHYIPAFIKSSQRYICTFGDCNFRALSETHFECHYKESHRRITRFECIHCKEEITKIAGFNKVRDHFRLHSGLLYLCFCNFYTHSRVELIRHANKEHKRMDIPITTYTRTESETKKQIEIVHPKKQKSKDQSSKLIKCLLCNQKANEMNMTKHLKNCHDIAIRHQCDYCSFHDTRSAVEEHLSCFHPNKIYRYKSIYLRINDENNTDDCTLVVPSDDPVCIIEDSNQNAENGVNLKRSHSADNDESQSSTSSNSAKRFKLNENIYHCINCQFVADSIESLNEHAKINHEKSVRLNSTSTNAENSKITTLTEKLVHKCNGCMYVSDNIDDLGEHIRINHLIDDDPVIEAKRRRKSAANITINFAGNSPTKPEPVINVTVSYNDALLSSTSTTTLAGSSEIIKPESCRTSPALEVPTPVIEAPKKPSIRLVPLKNLLRKEFIESEITENSIQPVPPTAFQQEIDEEFIDINAPLTSDYLHNLSLKDPQDCNSSVRLQKNEIQVINVDEYKPSLDEISFQCYHCATRFHKMNLLITHWSLTHCSVKSKLNFRYRIIRKMCCVHCGYKASFAELKEHHLNHHNHANCPMATSCVNYPLRCTECKYTATSKEELILHAATAHKNLIHLTESSFDFLDQQLLDKLLKLGHGSFSKRCNYCKNIYQDQDSFINHIQSSHLSQARVQVHKGYQENGIIYGCKQCTVLYDREKYAVEHLREHTNPYVCNFCALSFKNYFLLRNHYQGEHQSHETGYRYVSVQQNLPLYRAMVVIFPNGLVLTKGDLQNTCYGDMNDFIQLIENVEREELTKSATSIDSSK